MAKKKNKKAALFEVLSKNSSGPSMGVPDWVKAKPAPTQKQKKDPNLSTPMPMTEETRKQLEAQQELAKQQAQLKAQQSRTQPVTGMTFAARQKLTAEQRQASAARPANNTTEYIEPAKVNQANPVEPPAPVAPGEPPAQPEAPSAPLLEQANIAPDQSVSPKQSKPAVPKKSSKPKASKTKAKKAVKQPKPQSEKAVEPPKTSPAVTQQAPAISETQPAEPIEYAAPAQPKTVTPPPLPTQAQQATPAMQNKPAQQQKRDYTPIYPKLKRPEFTQKTPEPTPAPAQKPTKTSTPAQVDTTYDFDTPEPLIKIVHDRFVITMNILTAMVTIGIILVLMVGVFVLGRITAPTQTVATQAGTQTPKQKDASGDSGQDDSQTPDAGQAEPDPGVEAKTAAGRKKGLYYLIFQKLPGRSESDKKNAFAMKNYCDQSLGMSVDIMNFKVGKGFYAVVSRVGFKRPDSPAALAYVKKVEKAGKNYLKYARENNLAHFNFEQPTVETGNGKLKHTNYYRY